MVIHYLLSSFYFFQVFLLSNHQRYRWQCQKEMPKIFISTWREQCLPHDLYRLLHFSPGAFRISHQKGGWVMMTKHIKNRNDHDNCHIIFYLFKKSRRWRKKSKVARNFHHHHATPPQKNNPSGKFNFEKKFKKNDDIVWKLRFPNFPRWGWTHFYTWIYFTFKKAAIQSNPFFLNLIFQPSLLRWSGIPFRQLHVVHNPPWFISLGSIYILRCGWGPPWPSVKCYGSTTVQAPPTLCRVSVASSIAKVDRLIPKPIFFSFSFSTRNQKKNLLHVVIMVQAKFPPPHYLLKK
jgi:hypothetical protein